MVLRNFEYIILAYAPLQCFDNKYSRFHRNVIIYAFVIGSGEEDTTASSFTTSGEQPLETTTSEITGLLLIKISFSFCQRQWHPRCRHCRRFKNVTGMSGNKDSWLQKDSAFQFQKRHMPYCIARLYIISNRTQIYWNCFFVNSCTTFAGVACIKSVKFPTSLFRLANGMWSIAQIEFDFLRNWKLKKFPSVCLLNYYFGMWFVFSTHQLQSVALSFVDYYYSLFF